MESNNNRIAKNTLMLYCRMLISMLVGLYTSRVILQTLGVENYGIYNVVGGFVSMFSLISSSMQGAVSRFLVFELGKGNMKKLQEVFSASLFIMIGLSLLIILATETIGIWYLNHKMVIPEERLHAAFWCFQFSVASFVLSLISTPFSSSIIAHERMDIYAYMSILDVCLKLLICFAVIHSPIDRLVFYAILLFLISIIDQFIYWNFCRRMFAECVIIKVFEKNLFKQMFSFAGWSFVGSSASILRFQGANLLLNAFGGPVVNAANGIANTVCGVVNSFVGSFTQAFNPQITKRYAAEEYNSLMQLIIFGAKYSYCLLFFLALPLFLNTHFVLELWLGIVPSHSVAFTRFVLIYLLVESLSYPLVTVKSATGHIRRYQTVVGGIVLLMIPLSYLCLKENLPVESVSLVNIIISVVALFSRLYMLKGDFPMWSSRSFLQNVLFKVLIVSIVSSILPMICHFSLAYGWLNFFLSTTFSIFCVIFSVLYLGSNQDERNFIICESKKIIKKLR